MSNETKHTPGPWVGAGRRGIDGGEYGYDEVVSAACDPCGWSGCSGARVVMTDADERLIAAAPELLAACKAAAKLCDIFEQNLASPTLDQARAAIAKAEGK